MPRVVSMSLQVQVYATVTLPSWIHLNPEREGIDWFVRYSTLNYKDKDKEWKEWDLGTLDYDGCYKRPDIEVQEEEECESESESEAEE